MNNPLIKLWPQSTSATTQIKTVYLQEQCSTFYRPHTQQPFVYANFIQSLDGRIAVPNEQDGALAPPKQILNGRDWRLFQELAVQADVVLTTGRYLRDYAAGRAQEILRVYDDPNLADLKDWRTQHHMSSHPALAIVSASLDFTIPTVLKENGRSVFLITTASSPLQKREQLAPTVTEIIIAGEQQVDGKELISQLVQRQLYSVYSAAGPKILHMLLASQQLNRLYLTFAHQLLANTQFSTILEGVELAQPPHLTLNSLYLDPHPFDEAGQLFASYNLTYPNH